MAGAFDDLAARMQPMAPPPLRPPALRCGTCGAACATPAALLAHLRRAYHGVQCLRCGALFADRRAFDAHSLRHHGVQNVPQRARGA